MLFLIKALVRCFGEKRFWLALNCPDGRSGRTLVFITNPTGNPFKGITLKRWKFGQFNKFEDWLAKNGIGPTF